MILQTGSAITIGSFGYRGTIITPDAIAIATFGWLINTSYNLSLYVLDNVGNGIPGVVLTFTGTDGEDQQLTTDANGQVEENISQDIYDIVAKLHGWMSVTVENANIGDAYTKNIVLCPELFDGIGVKAFDSDVLEQQRFHVISRSNNQEFGIDVLDRK